MVYKHKNEKKISEVPVIFSQKQKQNKKSLDIEDYAENLPEQKTLI